MAVARPVLVVLLSATLLGTVAVVVGFVFFITHRRLFVSTADETTRPQEDGSSG